MICLDVYLLTSFHFEVPPVIMAHPTNYIVALDKPVTMVCEAKGHPNPEVTWNKDGHVVLESIRQRILSTGALQIAFAQSQDTGRYTCTASNPAGSSNSVMVLTVHSKSYFMRLPTSTSSSLRSVVHLTVGCIHACC